MYARSITFLARSEVTTEQASVIYHELTRMLSAAEGFLVAADIDAAVRPSILTVEDWVRLSAVRADASPEDEVSGDPA